MKLHHLLRIMRKRLQEIEAERQQILNALAVMDRYEGRGAAGEIIEGVPIDDAEFTNMKLNDAIERVLESEYPRKLRARDIAERLMRGGYHTKSGESNFISGVGFMAGRLVKWRRVERVGKGLYKAKRDAE